MDQFFSQELNYFNLLIEKESLMKSMSTSKNNSKISNVISINRKKKLKKTRKRES